MNRVDMHLTPNSLNLSAEWIPPAVITVAGHLEVVNSPFDALFWLDNHWPEDAPPPEEVQLACYEALLKGRNLAEAREQFLAACREVGWVG
jgi:adenylate cyclase